MKSPVWLFMGPEIGERNAAVDTVVKTISKQYGDIETHTAYAGDTGMGDIISLLQNASLFSSAKLIILKSAELIKKKEDIDLLTDWIQSVSKKDGISDSFLILISDETSVAKKISDSVLKTQQKIFWELFENKKQEWVRGFLFREGIEIEDEAVDELLELVENNTDALKTACSHLALYFQKGAHISQEDIEKLFAHNKEETPFSLFNALTLKDLEAALSISQKIILSKNSSPIQIIAGLSYCFRRLQDWHKIHRENEYLDDFSLKRFGFSGKTALSQYRRAAKLWNEVQCVKIIALLSETDLDLRSLGTSLQNIVMEMCLYEIVCKSGNKSEQYNPNYI
ncbi:MULTISPECIES: DNA polymerase III subunit delta [unclassified Treponema]|uniref:DNA polymerase III subunit delta n=1 Tax=unclassified Treponema TaxID=2638727 RepID=UPI0020A29A00|nr:MULTISPECIES: DNA polymerase III subunit delta [unclassified Treponema]UTC67209.1 DNA polymerase III subunit delta [Treponema sp. OMZ 789]UTC69938.1 DNA polymerase III subunit delta [Treponema sp. OMZ 790]UTC72653.1 DNA polymerase III subunit delta [Treponema sp. OMZ 791]